MADINKMQIFGAMLSDVGSALRGKQGKMLPYMMQQQIDEEQAQKKFQQWKATNNMLEVDPKVFNKMSPKGRQQLGITAQAPTQIGDKFYVATDPLSTKEQLDIQSKKLGIEGKKLMNKLREKRLQGLPQEVSSFIISRKKKGLSNQKIYDEAIQTPLGIRYSDDLKDILNLSRGMKEEMSSALEEWFGEK